MLTTVGVALVAHAITDLGWAEAFVLGAVVSPTDPIAATAIGRRLGVPRRLIDIVEGESLVNDGTALVLLRTAIVAAVAGDVLGLGRGRAARAQHRRRDRRRARGRLRDPPRPARARQPAARGDDRLPHRLPRLPARDGARRLGRARGRHRRRLHGLVHARADDRADAPRSATGSGRSSTSCSTCCSSASSGCSSARSSTGSPGENGWSLVGDAALIALAVIVLRIVWVFPATYLPRMALPPSIHERDPSPPWRYPAFIAWNGMRGAVTIAAALLIPLETDAGAPFPGRDLIVFFAFAVVLVTLVGQGLTLPAADPRAPARGRRGRRRGGGARADPRRRGGARAARRARERGVGARRHRRAHARPVPVPHRPLLGARRPRRRRQDREAVDEVPAAPPRAARRRAPRRRSSCATPARSATR